MTRRRLSVVAEGEQLRGAGPAAFEKLARSAEGETPQHRGLVMIATTLAKECAVTCVPPSAKAELLGALELAFLWVRKEATIEEAADARASCFQMVAAIEKMTENAVLGAQTHLGKQAETPLDPHADHVVTRYARLGAHFSVSAVCHTLDAIERPEAALQILTDIEGARCYQAVGLGAARHAPLRKAAWDQAKWEATRPGTPQEHDSVISLAVQVFHEYLGGRYRQHADAERIRNSDFISWAVSGRSLR